MMTKLGVNSVCAKKSGPNVKESINVEAASSFRKNKTVTCSCGKKFQKDCPSEETCEVSSFPCPYCGTRIQ